VPFHNKRVQRINEPADLLLGGSLWQSRICLCFARLADKSQLYAQYSTHTAPVVAIAWSPDGRYIASGSWDTTVQVWEVSTGRCVQTYRGHSNWVNALSWPANSRYIASGSWDKTVQVWQAVSL
jgi:WD40 repeat protein